MCTNISWENLYSQDTISIGVKTSLGMSWMKLIKSRMEGKLHYITDDEGVRWEQFAGNELRGMIVDWLGNWEPSNQHSLAIKQRWDSLLMHGMTWCRPRTENWTDSRAVQSERQLVSRRDSIDELWTQWQGWALDTLLVHDTLPSSVWSGAPFHL